MSVVKAESSIRRQPCTFAQNRSKLDQYTCELLQLDNQGVSGTGLQKFLAEKGVLVARATVYRWLHKNRQDG